MTFEVFSVWCQGCSGIFSFTVYHWYDRVPRKHPISVTPSTLLYFLGRQTSSHVNRLAGQRILIEPSLHSTISFCNKIHFLLPNETYSTVLWGGEFCIYLPDRVYVFPFDIYWSLTVIINVEVMSGGEARLKEDEGLHVDLPPGQSSWKLQHG